MVIPYILALLWISWIICLTTASLLVIAAAAKHNPEHVDTVPILFGVGLIITLLHLVVYILLI